MRLTFTATSKPEVMSLILSFGREARLIKPKSLVKKLKIEMSKMTALYRDRQ
ncbi:MAG: hypothetical protein C4582_11995 [Desulfobacteraceae bacterium]|nr:MAG: hypothetical protein C4582_11995 [Desulfobacteraceae bacterium]